MEARAQANYVRISPRKVKIVLDLIRNKPVDVAIAIVRNTPKAACVGGPYGFSEKVYQVANEKISMSKMTFSHQMIRLIFVEQIYRAMTILNGGPYHHE